MEPNPMAQFVGEHPAIVSAREAAEKIARAGSTPVLLLGEDGTGKRLLARIIHDLSGRAGQPFVVVRCAKQPERPLADALFGQPAGAGGEPQRAPGLVRRPGGGTLFLDDVTELPFPLQLRLLEILEEEPAVPAPTDARVMAASTMPLERAVEGGRFHRDLCARLAVFPIALPALRERRRDVLLLARHFIEQLNAELGRQVRALAPEAEQRLLQADWLGNVRELRNAIERAMILETSEVLHAEHLPGEAATAPPAVGPLSFVQLPPRGVSLDAVERELVRQALARVGGNQVRAAALLGISRDALRNRMRKFGLPSDRRRME